MWPAILCWPTIFNSKLIQQYVVYGKCSRSNSQWKILLNKWKDYKLKFGQISQCMPKCLLRDQVSWSFIDLVGVWCPLLAHSYPMPLGYFTEFESYTGGKFDVIIVCLRLLLVYFKEWQYARLFCKFSHSSIYHCECFFIIINKIYF